MYVFEDTKLPGVISYESVECTYLRHYIASPTVYKVPNEQSAPRNVVAR